jgi:hypothetical protein
MRAIPVLLLASLPFQAALAATANIEFEKPEAFTDAGRPFPASARLESLPFLREHLVKEVARRLPADQALSVWITDVDLAGQYPPGGSGARDVRVVKEIYPPRIDLRFRLTRADGSTVKDGTRTLRDSGFLSSGGPADRQDALRYEKAMLDRWLEDEFRR